MGSVWPRHRRATTIRGRATGGERGAVMVEFLVVVPVLLVLMVGLVELGLIQRDRLIASSASRAAARVISSGGDSRLADFDGLKAAEAALADMTTADVVRVVVFSPNAAGEMPAACATGSVPNVCNHYGPADLARGAADFTGTNNCTGSSPDKPWCPLSRETEQDAGLDWIGVYVELEHYSSAPMFGDRPLVAETVMRIEPRLPS